MATRPHRWRLIIATVIGNGLEWYDFSVFGIFAVTISTLFFPAGPGPAAILSTLALFGVAYVFRPLGGLVFGHYADVIGRRRVLLIVIATMTLGLAILAFAPTYAMIGIGAPMVLLIARIVQGFSVGGEFATGTTFLIEHAPPGQHGLYGGFQFVSQGLSVMLGGFVGLLVIHGLGPHAVAAWGWRIPFLLGLAIGPLGYYLRLTLEETPEFAASTPERSPLASALTQHSGRIFTCFCMTLGGTASFYVLYIVMPTYAIRTLGLGLGASFVAPLIGGIASVIGAVVGGICVDRFGRKLPLVICVTTLVVLVLPAFAWLSAAPSVTRMAAVELVLSLFLGAYGGSGAAVMADLFPVGVRASGLTISYNVGVMAFGGFAPLVVTWLTEVTKSPLAPAYYDLAGLVCALGAILVLPQAWGETPEPADPPEPGGNRGRHCQLRSSARLFHRVAFLVTP